MRKIAMELNHQKMEKFWKYTYGSLIELSNYLFDLYQWKNSQEWQEVLKHLEAHCQESLKKLNELYEMRSYINAAFDGSKIIDLTKEIHTDMLQYDQILYSIWIKNEYKENKNRLFEMFSLIFGKLSKIVGPMIPNVVSNKDAVYRKSFSKSLLNLFSPQAIKHFQSIEVSSICQSTYIWFGYELYYALNCDLGFFLYPETFKAIVKQDFPIVKLMAQYHAIEGKWSSNVDDMKKISDKEAPLDSILGETILLSTGQDECTVLVKSSINFENDIPRERKIHITLEERNSKKSYRIQYLNLKGALGDQQKARSIFYVTEDKNSNKNGNHFKP